MMWKLYILIALVFASMLDFIAYAKYQTQIWEYIYFFTEKLLWIWVFSIILSWIKFVRTDFVNKIKARRVIKGAIGLMLIRILWEIVSIIKGYNFMLTDTVNNIYLILISCYLGLMIYWISKSAFWKPKG